MEETRENKLEELLGKKNTYEDLKVVLERLNNLGETKKEESVR